MSNERIISVVLGFMCFALTAGIFIQIKTVRHYSTASGQNYEQNNLRAEVLRYKERYENKLKEIETVDNELTEKIEEATNQNTGLEEARNQIKEGNKLIGMSEVSGPGATIRLEDSTLDASKVLDPTALVVHDIDLLYIINELKNAGAEAIAVNEQRIVSTTAIECGGNIITVNGEKIGSPFLIKAIGLPENFANLDRPGGYLERMREESLTAEFKKSNRVTIPRYTGIINYKYVQNIK